MNNAADAIAPEGQAERRTVSYGGFMSKVTKVFVIYFFVNQFGNFLTNNKSNGNFKESSLVDPHVPHPLSTSQDITNVVVEENPNFKYISKLHSYMVPDVDHLSFKVSVKQQCNAEMVSLHLLKSKGPRMVHNASDGDDNIQEEAPGNLIDTSILDYVFPTMELREMGTDDPEEDEKKWKQLEDEERQTEESQTGTGLFKIIQIFAARELEALWATVTGRGDRKASIAGEKEALIQKVQKRQEQSYSGSFPETMSFSLNEAPRFIQRELDITDSFFNNCTLVAEITVTYSKSAGHDEGKDGLFPSRVIHFSHPLISFVEKEERELMNLFAEDGDHENVGAVDKTNLALEGVNEKQETKKKGRKKNKVISKTKRKKSKVDETIDTLIMWVKEQVFGSEPKETVVSLPVSDGGLSAIEADGVSTVPFSLIENNKGANTKSGKVKTKMVAKFLPKITVSPVVDATSYSISDVPVPLKNVLTLVSSPTISSRERDALIKQTILGGNTQKMNEMSIEERTSYGFYSPLVYLNNFWTVDDHLVELSEYSFRDEKTGEKSFEDEDEDTGDQHNGDEKRGAMAMDGDASIQLNKKLEKLRSDPSQRLKVNFTLELRPISLLKYMLYTQFDASMDMHEDFGTMTRKERDETKMMLLGTHPVLLVVTMVVSILHMLFEYLAFKNEVKFWKSRKNFKGLSLRTVAVNCYFQTIIFMYLMDSEQTSYMILFPCGIGVLIEFWKLFKTLKIQRNSENGKMEFSFNKSYDSVTSEYDRTAMKWLGITLTPFLLGYTAYSAVYDDHKGWYSFIVATQVRFIYFSGFVMMTPQIFINYKLKSVAQLPWRMFVYRFLNTIIDDLFAFIVTMPTMHRLACFRDDVVFFILLYQRWKYPVDTLRTEDGESIEEIERENIDKEDVGKLTNDTEVNTEGTSIMKETQGASDSKTEGK